MLASIPPSSGGQAGLQRGIIQFLTPQPSATVALSLLHSPTRPLQWLQPFSYEGGREGRQDGQRSAAAELHWTGPT